MSFWRGDTRVGPSGLTGKRSFLAMGEFVCRDGASVGASVGNNVGENVGINAGAFVGETVGSSVPPTSMLILVSGDVVLSSSPKIARYWQKVMPWKSGFPVL